MKKKLLSVMLAVTLSVSCMTPLIALAEEDVVTNDGAGDIVRAGSCGDTATYTMNADGVLTISGNGHIYENAFWNWDDVKYVEVSPEITGIGKDAFSCCHNLISVKGLKGVTSIDEGAFGCCNSLNSITLPEKLTSIGNTVFANCSSLKHITVPKGVISIGVDAFRECDSLSSIDLPEGLTYIGSCAFTDCNSLRNITIPKGVTTIGEYAFIGCRDLENIIIESGNTQYDSRDNCNAIIETDTNELIAGCKNTVIPTSVTSIGGAAFSGCSNLKSITIPEGVNSISESAFSECRSLSSITIPNNVTNIANWTFERCSNLKSISLPEGLTYIGIGVFNGCNSLESITIPKSMMAIREYAFNGCNSLSGIVIPKAVIEIYDNVFTNCGNLKNITVESDNRKYDSRNNCNAIIETSTNKLITGCKNTIIPTSVTSIGDYAFEGCSELKNINIPKKITNIGGRIFSGCNGLERITVESDNRKYDSRNNCNAIIETGTNKLIAGCKDTIIPTDIKNIGDSAFYGCSSLNHITIPKGIISIERDAFNGCNSLSNMIIPEGVTSLSDRVFFKCSNLKSITIPEGVTNIGDEAFYECSSLNNIIIPKSVNSIGVNVFVGCNDPVANPSIFCYKDSFAHKYMVENNIPYKLIDKEQNPAKINIQSATIVVNDLTYSKKAQTVSPKVSISGKTLTQGKDYTVSGNTTVTDIGTYKITITGIGEYTGSVNVTYRLSCKHNYDGKWTVDKKANMKNTGKRSRHCTICNAKADETVIRAIKTASLSKTSFTYNGKNRKPSVTVRDTKGNTLKKGTDYTVSYPKNCKKVGQYTVTIKFKGNYTGSTKKTYCIHPKGTSLSEVKAKSKSFTAKWKKQTTQTRGYRLQYATDKKFKKNVKNVTIKKNKTTSQTVRKLKAKKKYYVRIRTYQTIKVNGKEKKLYSDWSKTKNVTVKK